MKGKVALITGGTRGIGKACALKLASMGADVAMLYAGNQESARRAQEEVEALGVRAMVVQCDVSDYAQTTEAVKAVKAAFGAVDILINNAGINRDKLAMRMSPEDFRDVLDVNLVGAFHMIRALLADFVRRRSGRIINITSVAGIIGNPGQANYSASKAGMIGMTKSIAKEIASRGITCNAVAPGFIQTDMSGAMGEEALKRALAYVPAGRIGEADEIAEAVAFLAGDGASYITGSVLQVDGGLAM